MDELLPGTSVRASRIRGGREDLSLAGEVAQAATGCPARLSSIAQHRDPRENVAAALHILAGRGDSPAREAVALNAALLLRTARAVPTLAAGLTTARDILNSGAGLDALLNFVRLTGGSPREIDALLHLNRVPHSAAVSPRQEHASC